MRYSSLMLEVWQNVRSRAYLAFESYKSVRKATSTLSILDQLISFTLQTAVTYLWV